MSEPDRLPIIDVTALRGGASDDMRAVAREIGAACERHGFFYITGHGIPAALTERMFAESARFFAIPPEDKLKIKINRANRVMFGLAHRHRISLRSRARIKGTNMNR